MKYIPQLIGHTFGITYLDNHVVVGVAIYPVIDAADLDVVLQFNREKLRYLGLRQTWGIVSGRIEHDGLRQSFFWSCCLIQRSSG